MTNIPAPQLILFDWDNTLVDSWNVIHDAMMQTFERLQIKPLWQAKAETQQRGQRSLRDSFPALFGARAEEAKKIYYEEYLALHLREITALTGAGETLALLRDKGIALGVISNKAHPILLTEIAHLGWQDFFYGVVGAGLANADKPNDAPFWHALQLIYGRDARPMLVKNAHQVKDGEADKGRAASDNKDVMGDVMGAGITGHAPPMAASLAHIWYVGDMAVDVTFARNCGIRSVMIPSETLPVAPDVTVKDFASLMALLG
ncbi:MAG: HAD-IA family hydrolase [Alphaproteobacteria bacterium]|nr:HAD-IA family hydrolase [Alphaproteobacteria bacterium]